MLILYCTVITHVLLLDNGILNLSYGDYLLIMLRSADNVGLLILYCAAHMHAHMRACVCIHVYVCVRACVCARKLIISSLMMLRSEAN